MFACIVIVRQKDPQISQISQILSAESAAGDLPSADRLLRLAFSFSPRVEPIAPDAIILDIEGLEHLFGRHDELAQTMTRRAAESGMQVNVAIARNAPAAISAARGFAGITVIPPGEEARTLSSLPLHLLAAAPEIEDTWKLWGLKSFGDLAALPAAGVAERLGAEGARLHRIAQGAGARPLIPFIPWMDFHASEELEHPVELLDPLSFILASLLNQVCASLEARGLGASEIQLRFKLGVPELSEALENPPENVPVDFERRLSLPVPLRDSMALLKLLRLDLEAHPPQAPVTAVSLRATPAQPRVTQNSLFIPPAPEPQKLELTLARIAKLAGEGNAGSPALMDTHRPGAFEVRPFRVSQGNPSRGRKRAVAQSVSGRAPRCNPAVSFRVFRPPLAAEVECYRGEPLQVRARGIRGKVVSFAGPWRSSGDWWTTDPWQRDEWDVELAPVSRMRGTGEAMACEPSSAVPEGRNILAAGVPRIPGTYGTRTLQRANVLYRIYRDLKTGAWYIEGSYD